MQHYHQNQKETIDPDWSIGILFLQPPSKVTLDKRVRGSYAGSEVGEGIVWGGISMALLYGRGQGS